MAITLEQIKKKRVAAFVVSSAQTAKAKQLRPWETFPEPNPSFSTDSTVPIVPPSQAHTTMQQYRAESSKTEKSNQLDSDKHDNSTTTTPPGDKELSELFLSSLQQFEFDHVLGPNDLLGFWRSGRFKSYDELLESVEHIEFYLASDQSRGIDHPKAYAIKQLRKGFYGCPANFKSWELRQEEAKIEAKRIRTAQRLELQRKRLDADFDVWASELPQDERLRLLQAKLRGGLQYAAQRVIRQILFDHFARSQGAFEFVTAECEGGDDSSPTHRQE